MWQAIFSTVNVLAVIGWVVLAALPRTPLARAVVLYLGVGLLCLIYTAGLVSIITGMADPGGPTGSGASFTTIEGVRGIFASDGGATVGWTHYLALDLFTGMWIARDADAKGISRWLQLPVLAMTFLVGPVGLLIWLIVREPAARKAGRLKE